MGLLEAGNRLYILVGGVDLLALRKVAGLAKWEQDTVVTKLSCAMTALLVCGSLNSQEPVFRATTRLIQVNVVALDKKGKPVADLKKEDFIITDKGKPQTVAMFAVEKKSERKAIPKLAKGFFTNYTGGTVSPNVTVILLDSLNTSWGDQAQARQHVYRFLSQIKPEDRVAIMVLGRRLKVLHSFTDDKERLLKAVNSWRGTQEAGGVDSDSDAGSMDIFGAESGGADEQELRQEQRILTSLAAMEAVGNYLAGTPGRKNLIWVTSGFPLTVGYDMMPSQQVMTSASSRGIPRAGPPPPPKMPSKNARTFTDEVDRTMRVMNNANVAVYPVDARGLSVDTNAHVHQDSMHEFADRTGGKAFTNRNDLDRAIREVMEETELTYSLAFYPNDDKSDGKYRDIKVKVNRPGVQVRYRKGYVAAKQGDNDKDRELQLRQAVRSPIEAAALGILAQVVRKDDKLLVQVLVDPAGIALDNLTGRKVGRLDLLFVQRDKEGKDFDGSRDSIELNLLPDNYAKMMKGGFLYKKEIPLNPKADFLRIVVRDSTSTLSGSVTASW